MAPWYSPKFSGVLLFDVAPVPDEVAVLLQEVYALLGVQGQVLVLILQQIHKDH